MSQYGNSRITVYMTTVWSKDQSGKSAEVDLVDAPVDNQVSRYTEHNQEVHAGTKPDRW